MKNIVAGAALLAAGVFVYLLPAGARPDAPTSPNDEAIHKVLMDYVAAFNKGDVDAASRFFAADAEVTDDTGKVSKGRDAIRQELQKLAKAGKSMRIEAEIISCRALVPDACSVDVATTIKPADGLPIQTKCHFVVAKRDGQWSIVEARESGSAAATAESGTPLDQLAWMVGEWADTSDRVDVRINCEWFANKHFLVRSFTVTTDGELDLQGTEIVGYDPAAKQIRSWVFDSDGTFSEGTWAQQGKSWVETMKGVLADGRKASAIHSFTPADGNSYVFSSANREVGGQVQPNITEIKMVRETSGDDAGQPGKE
jgi:uncharacterized protein (TIGR02246 family)